MLDWQLAVTLIDKHVDLQRIKTALDKDNELEYQIRVTRTKLEAIGVATERLEK